MRRKCDYCHEEFDAQRSDARFCPDKPHRQAFAKNGPLPDDPGIDHEVRVQVGGVFAAYLKELVAAGRHETALGMHVLNLAAALDKGNETGSSRAALSKELAARMTEAMAGASTGADLVDDLQARRDARRAAS